MFKKVYTAIAVFMLTLLLSIVSFHGSKQLFVWLAETNWIIVGSAFIGTILLAILSNLCYNYFVKHRETVTDALEGFKNDILVVWNIISKYFMPPQLKGTLTHLFVFIILVNFSVGSVVVTKSIINTCDIVANFDAKLKTIEDRYISRLDRQEDEIESLKQSDHDKDMVINQMKKDMEILKSDNLSLLNTVKRAFSSGDTKNSPSRPYLGKTPVVLQ